MHFFTRFLFLAAPLVANAAPFTLTSANALVPGKWIVQLKPGTNAASITAHHDKVRSIRARNLARRDGNPGAGSGVEHEFHIGTFKAYVGSFDATTIEELKALPEVLVVEQDYIMTTSALVTQEDAPWGLARISSRAKGSTSYVYDDSAGEGTFSYIVDTGIFIDHVDFNGRAVWGANLVPNNTFDTDNQGHGTHVAGIIGSTTYGVAKQTNLIAVKVFENGRGTASTVIAGFEWAINDIISKGRQNTAVINMSLGGKASATWDAAISAAWEKGVLAVVAAGNENMLGSNNSPCRSEEVLCVGNAQIDDTRFPGASGSNYGDAVDIWAAGTKILSTYPTSENATARLTGTSMASPHVAGLVSYLRGLEGASSAADVKARVLALATPDLVADAMGAANLMAFNGAEQTATNKTLGYGKRTVRLA
ncbi:subtilisin-like protease-like protein [Ophiobolus disseminans]|uniref:Subtilisin-like protease-like protein n=1 Tax=Ophiobolus disseminans TaxID=1469910 RepID=A0A6A6ZW95_9PLEO|nr:subtilisin-like protease-like protein [Ophiobolus disseminans]